MKPNPFAYLAPRDLAHALDLLAEHGDAAKVLAGGQSLGPLMNLRLATPEVLVDINGVAELSAVDVDDDGCLRIGAIARQRWVERDDDVLGGWPVISEALEWVAHPTIRNRGTFGGTLAHADPASEMPAVAVALRAHMVLRRASGERVVPAENFFVSHFTTVCEPDELLVEARFPAPAVRRGHSWMEYAPRHGDFAIVGVAAAVTLAEDMSVESSRIVVSGVGDAPRLLSEPVTEPLRGQTLASATDPALVEFAATAAESLHPGSDSLGSAAYRKKLFRHLVCGATVRAAARAKEMS